MNNTSYRVKGAFFESNKSTGPAFMGFIELDAALLRELLANGNNPAKVEIALWPKTSAKGLNYFQVSEDKKKQKTIKPMAAASPFRPKLPVHPQTQNTVAKGLTDDDFDDTIPF